MVDPLGGVVTGKRVAARQLNATTGSGRWPAWATSLVVGRMLVAVERLAVCRTTV